jgi:intraflagellar transport protein 172
VVRAQAINLYLGASMPGKAARVIVDNNITQPSNLLENVALALEETDMHERAGDFYERMGQRQRALDAFVKGHAYRKAVELARKHFQNQVVSLEEAWGDHLVSVSQLDMAINHYMEAHAQTKAITAAIKARQWNKALSLADQLGVDEGRPFYAELASHYEAAKQVRARAKRAQKRASCTAPTAGDNDHLDPFFCARLPTNDRLLLCSLRPRPPPPARPPPLPPS